MRLTRIFIAAVLMTAATAAQAKPVTLAAETNLRKAPGTTSEVITLIPKGERVEVGECDAGWCKVTWNGNDGYSIGRNLNAAPRVAARRAPRTVYEDDGDVEVEYGSGYYGGPVYAYGPGYGYGYYGPRPYWGYGYGGRYYRGYRRW